LILSKIVKIVVTRYHILKLKCTKSDFGWGSALELGSLQRSPDPRLDLRGPLLREGSGVEGKGRERKGRTEGDQRGRERVPPPLESYFDHWYCP